MRLAIYYDKQTRKVGIDAMHEAALRTANFKEAMDCHASNAISST